MEFVYIIMIVFGILGVISVMFNVSKTAKKDLLKKMYENGDIDGATYTRCSISLDRNKL